MTIHDREQELQSLVIKEDIDWKDLCSMVANGEAELATLRAEHARLVSDEPIQAEQDRRLGAALRRVLAVSGPDCVSVRKMTTRLYRGSCSGPHSYGDDNHSGTPSGSPAEALEALAARLEAAP